MEHSTKVISTINEYCLKHAGAYEARPFGEYPICYKVMGKIFAQFNSEEKFYKITLKCEPDKASFYRQIYPEIVTRGYHCPPVQQPFWNTVNLDAFLEMDVLFQMIDEAYAAVTNQFSRKKRSELLKLAEVEFKDTDGQDSDFVMLCSRLDSTLDEIVGGRLQRVQYHQYNQLDNIHDVIVAYQDGKPVACGAFKMYDEEHAELKRIYVDASHRKIGLGSELIRRLEAKAKIKGYRWCILETGKALEAAYNMYKKAGYKVIPNYGQYADMADSVCMERKI